jgi:hypothetical protein
MTASGASPTDNEVPNRNTLLIHNIGSYILNRDQWNVTYDDHAPRVGLRWGRLLTRSPHCLDHASEVYDFVIQHAADLRRSDRTAPNCGFEWRRNPPSRLEWALSPTDPSERLRHPARGYFGATPRSNKPGRQQMTPVASQFPQGRIVITQACAQ